MVIGIGANVLEEVGTYMIERAPIALLSVKLFQPLPEIALV